jgi:hypothetical protein
MMLLLPVLLKIFMTPYVVKREKKPPRGMGGLDKR